MPVSTCDAVSPGRHLLTAAHDCRQAEQSGRIPEVVSQANGKQLALKCPRCEDHPRAIPEENSS
jgi:hypothetical protein